MRGVDGKAVTRGHLFPCLDQLGIEHKQVQYIGI